MKKILLTLVLIYTCSINSQSWKYESGGNAFDGKYKTSYVVGKGTDYPYHKPLLAINMFNEESLNFYITSAGYFQDESETEILWVFSNEPNILYETIDFSISKDNKNIFLNLFKGSDDSYLMQLEFIEKLKKASKVSVRIKDKYSQNDISFSLYGSTKAINYAISKKYIENFKLAKKLVEEKAEKEKLEKAQKEEKLRLGAIKVKKLLNKYNLTKTETENIFAKLGYQSTLSSFTLSDIDSLNIYVFKSSSEFSIFKNNKELYKFYFFDDAIPTFVNSEREKMRIEELKFINKHMVNVKSMLLSDGMNEDEFSLIESEIHKELERSSSSKLKDIKDFSVVLPNKFIKFSSLILKDAQDKSIIEIDRLDLSVPNYIKLKKESRNSTARKIIDDLILKYDFTVEEMQLIDNKLNENTYYNFEPRNMVKCDVVFSDYDKAITTFRFLDKKDSKMYELIIIDKLFTKRLKRKL